MTINTSGAAGISQRTNVWAERELLKHAMPVMVLEKVGKALQMPKNKSDTVKYRRPIPFPLATTPLVEGVTPSGARFEYEDVSTTLKQYGNLAVITDVIEDTHEDAVLKDMTMMMGENIGATMEQLNFGIVRGGTNVFYANGTARTDVNTPISLAKQRAVTRALKAQKATKITRRLASSNNYGTKSVEAAFVAIAHTDLENDIRNMSGFKAVTDYGTFSPISEHEIGAVDDVRYILSADLAPFASAGGTPGTAVESTNGTAADVYPVMYFGQDAWGFVALRGQGAVEPSIIPVGQKTKDDPLAQRGYIGWKTWWSGIRLNELWMARLEVAATNL